MANEINVTATLSFAKGSVSDSETITDTVDMSGTDYTKLTQTIGTSEEQLDFGDITTPGYCFIKNLDSTNYVEFRAATGVADFARLNAGEGMLFRFAADATAPFAIANTANVQVLMLLIED